MISVQKLRFSAIPRWRSRRQGTTLPQSPDSLPENRARRSVLRILLYGTTWITGLFLVLLLLRYFVGGYAIAGGRAIVAAVLLTYLFAASMLLRKGYQQAASSLLLIFYVAVSGWAAWLWDINLSSVTILMCITITLAGILMGARYSLHVAGLVIGILLVVQTLTTLQLHMPDVSWQRAQPSSFGDSIGYSVLFAGLALVTWVFGRQIERSLRQARKAEAALLKQKQLLAVRLRERTSKLRAAQLQEVQQLYSFAELGQLSTALLHDLANHLTDLTLDIDTLGARRSSHTAAIERAKQSISYLDDMVDKVRSQLQDRGRLASFDALQSVQTVVANLRPKFARADVQIDVTHTGTERALQYEGDAVRFAQVMTVLITNALEAAGGDTVLEAERRVVVHVAATKSAVTIRVSDWGVGIPAAERRRLFKPFYSTKSSGMGIGLFITKQIIETHFKGTITLESSSVPTTFKVVLPNEAAGRPDRG